MKIVCSQCQSRYNIPDEKIPETGKDVRCKKCNHLIHVPSPHEELLVLEEDHDNNEPSHRQLEDGSLICPRCNTRQQPGPECIYCGLVFHKYFNQEQKNKKIREESEKRKFGRVGITDEQFAAYLGPNSGYYVRTFNSFFENLEDSYAANWNWFAFLCGPYWFFYRRMYLYGFIAQGILFTGYLAIPFAIVYGLLGNYWYYKLAKKKISRALLSMPSSEKPEFKEDVLAALAQIGGVDPAFKVMGFIILGLFGSVFIIALLIGAIAAGAR